MKIYVCSPFRGYIDALGNMSTVEDNVIFAQECCRAVYSAGHLPVAPHLYFPQFMDDDDPAQRERAMSLALEIQMACEETWRFGGYISEGMKGELERAEAIKMPIRHFDWPEDAG